ncbi:MAG: DUF362 domain-containing protein [Polyangiaceae bacterium]
MARERDSEFEAAATSRRAFLGTAAAAAVAGVTFREGVASAIESPSNLAATPPAGFVPFAAPGRIVKVTKAGCLQANQIYPKPEDARAMLTRAMTELTGKSDLVAATKEFVSPDDVVCVKVNGIAEHNMGTNKELVLPFLEAMIAAGVKPQNITVLEQYGSFLAGTRVNDSNVPAGVKTSVHQNKDATMDERMIPGTGVKTKFVRVLTESTAVINFSLIKDHSICGYTGMLKNMTHGCQILPHYFHQHHASPQIALLYAQDVIKSRVRLCITDGFKLMFNGGPKWTEPRFVVPHESVYVTSDAVAMDTLGAELVDQVRVSKGLPTLAATGRPPAYIRAAGDLGLGVADRSAIQLREVTL